MKKNIFILVLFVMAAAAFGAVVGLPTERLALPVVEGNHLVVVWDDAAGDWINNDQGFESYDHAGIYEFKVPAWDTWYWIGLWDEAAGEYVHGKWIGHFKVN